MPINPSDQYRRPHESKLGYVQVEPFGKPPHIVRQHSLFVSESASSRCMTTSLLVIRTESRAFERDIVVAFSVRGITDAETERIARESAISCASLTNIVD